MYLHSKHTGEAARKVAADSQPFGMGLAQFDEVETVEVWVTSVKDPGEDRTEFRAFNKAEKPVAVRSVAGY